jgi:chromosomal replication initiator protein
MDDVQFIANTEKTQEELFHLFNALRDNNKQIIFSSDKHPALLPGFEESAARTFLCRHDRGNSRAGRREPLRDYSRKDRDAHGFSVADDIIQYIAENVRGNIRELEGIVNTIVVKIQYKGKGITSPMCALS